MSLDVVLPVLELGHFNASTGNALSLITVSNTIMLWFAAADASHRASSNRLELNHPPK